MPQISSNDISLIVAKDKKACKDLYEKYKNICFGICLRYARTHSDAKDMLQEGFLEVFRCVSSFNFEGSFEGWLKRIIVRQAIAFTRKYYKYKFSEIEENTKVETPQAIHDLNKDSLLEIIDSIPQKYKVIFNLRAVEEYSSKEVSELLSINEATVRSQFHRAKILVQKEIAKKEISENNTLNYGS